MIMEKEKFEEENMAYLDTVLKKLRAVVGEKDVLYKKVDLAAYRDSVHLSGPQPSAVVFPKNTVEVSEVLKILNQEQFPVIPRGAGTNLCGDTISQGETIILEMAKMDHILEVNILDRYIAAEPAVSNIAVQKALEPHGYFFAPDPASFGVSTIGGNIGENAGGMRCVKYGVTTDNVIGLELVLSDGQVIVHNGPLNGDAGYDLTGLMHGSEGTFGVITKAWLKIIKLPEEVKTLVAVFPALEDAAQTVSQIIGQGVIPSALEMIDHLAIQALEETRPMGYPLDAEAVLLIEVDGFAQTLEPQVKKIVAICQENNITEIRIAKSEEERQLLWLGRREALNCFVSKRPTYAQEDVVVPRAKLPEMLNIIKEISRKYSLVVASVCHAGDGNFHPTIIYDDQDQDEKKRAHSAFSEMMERAIELGGTITGEHGVGMEKLTGMQLLFSQDELSFMWRLKLAFDPKRILNPGKVIPEHISRMPMEKFLQTADQVNKIFRKESFLLDLEKVGMGAVILEEEVMDTYSLKSRQPGCVIKPKSAADVAMVVKLASQYQIKILPWGKGRGVMRGCTPSESESVDVVVDLSNLHKIIEIDGENLTAIVEAGVDFKEFQELLYQKGYMLPVDLWEVGSPTMGGMVDTNSTGSLTVKYGTLKNLVLGLEVVTGEGKIIHYGGKIIKNVAGYDLRKLFIGSWGALGIITKITLKIFPLPEKAVYRTYLTEDYKAFKRYIFTVQRKDVQLTSFDLMVNENKYYVHLCISGQAQAVDRQMELLNELEKDQLVLLEEREDPYLISGQSFYHKYLPEHGSNRLIIKSTILFSSIPQWIEIVQSMDKKGSLSIYGHAASGILYGIFSGDNNQDLADLMAKLGGCLKKDLPLGIHALEVYSDISFIKDEMINKNNSANCLNRNLKEMLDPQMIFSPGRNPGVFLG